MKGLNFQIIFTVWLENLTGIKFDEIASKLHNKNMTDFNLIKMSGKKAHSIRKINIDRRMSNSQIKFRQIFWLYGMWKTVACLQISIACCILIL